MRSSYFFLVETAGSEHCRNYWSAWFELDDENVDCGDPSKSLAGFWSCDCSQKIVVRFDIDGWVANTVADLKASHAEVHKSCSHCKSLRIALLASVALLVFLTGVFQSW